MPLPKLHCLVRLFTAAPLALLLCLAQFARGDAAADELRGRMIEAYAATQTYQAIITFEVSQKDGRWKLTQIYRVAFDRSGNKLLVDKLDVVVVSDGQMLYMRSDQVPGRHLELRAPQPLTYDGVVAQARFLENPLMPDVAMLLGHDPTAFSTRLRRLEPDPSDFQSRPRLQFRTRDGDMTFYIDPMSQLVTKAAWRLGAETIGPLQMEPMSLSYQVDILKRNDQFDEDTFVFDKAHSQPFSSLSDMVMGDAPSANELEGKSAPPVDLNTLEGRAFILSKADADVVVLDFWATWCMPCHRGLAMMQALHDWALTENKRVAIMPVNLKENPSEVAEFWNWKGFTMPTLLDEKGKVAQLYQVGPIPQTVVISKGKVQRVYIGVHPDMEGRLKKDIERLLSEG